MLLLKTPAGGSLFIQLLSKSLRKDIPWFLLKLYQLLCVAAIAQFFRSKYSLLVPCLGQINIYGLVSLTFCVTLDYFFVVYTFRFCVASKNVRSKTQLLTPPSLYTWIISISPSLSIRSTKSLKTKLQLAYSISHYSGETLRRLLNSLIQHFRTTHYLASRGKGEKPVEGKVCLSEEWRPFCKHSANNWILDTSRWWARIDITYMIFYSILFFTGFFDHLILTYLLTTASKLKQSSLKFQ